MTEEKNIKDKGEPQAAPKAEAPAAPVARDARKDARSFRIRRRDQGGRGRFSGRGRREQRSDIPEQSDYEEKTLEISRITRVTAGGKRMRFRALGIVGNRKGRVGFGLGKGADVAAATSKAFAQARKNLITVPLKNETIPHEMRSKFCSALVLLKPAPKGTGVKAGGAVRQVLEIAGVPNVVSKILGSSNKVNNVKAVFIALRGLRMPPKTRKEEPPKDAPAPGGDGSRKTEDQSGESAAGAERK
jgi:small subunit ribosomal protein S5